MTEKSTEPEAPAPGDTIVDDVAAETPAGPPAYGPPPPGWRPPRKKLTEQTFSWKGLLVAAVVGLVVGGGIASGIAAIVGHGDHGDRHFQIGQVPGKGQFGGRGYGGYGSPRGWGGGFGSQDGGQGDQQDPAQPPTAAPSQGSAG